MEKLFFSKIGRPVKEGVELDAQEISFKELSQNDVVSTTYSHSYDQNIGTTVIEEDREIVMMGSVNYLGLAHHKRVIESAIQAIEKHGNGGLGSRFSNGAMRIHQELDSKISEFLDRESSIVFNSGYMANLGVLSCLGHKPIIFSDKENHLSLYDGLILSRQKYYRFKHNDASHLEAQLRRHASAPNKWVILVGTFGATGENIDLVPIVEVAKKYGARIYLDDAHMIGIEGKNRRGLSEKFGIESEIDLLMGSFQMAFGSIGAFISGSKSLVDQIRYRSRPYIFSYTLPASTTMGLLTSLDIIQSLEGGNLVSSLKQNASSLRIGLTSLGFRAHNQDSHIVSIVMGDEEKTFLTANELNKAGVWAQKYINPSVPKGSGILRLTPIATHTTKHLDTVFEAFSTIR